MSHTKRINKVAAFEFGKEVGFSIGWPTTVLSTCYRIGQSNAARYSNAVDMIIREWGGVVRPDLVVVRRLSDGVGRDRRKMIAQAVDRLRRWAESIGAGFELLDTGAVRKSWTDWGNANNRMMLDEAVWRGFRLSAPEEAHALAAVDMCLRHYSHSPSQIGLAR